ncbi:hypothetical protein DL93DRAFT_240119 [Clavulina sp. PMI_390]|nr:hypothetical protein DL93DRAFT_240119 [Clavulina sp. PMI_390]
MHDIVFSGVCSSVSEHLFLVFSFISLTIRERKLPTRSYDAFALDSVNGHFIFLKLDFSLSPSIHHTTLKTYHKSVILTVPPFSIRILLRYFHLCRFYSFFFSV